MVDPFLIRDDDSRIKDKNIEDRYSKVYVGEDIMGEDLAPGLKRILSKKSINIFAIVLLGIFLLFVARVGYLQIWQGQYFLAQAEGNRIRTKAIKATRGIIYDRQGEILVKNVPAYSLQITPADLNQVEKEKIIKTVADYLDIEVSVIEAKLSSQPEFYYQPIEIVENLDYLKAIDLEVLTSTWPGVEIGVKGRRHYQYPFYTSHLLGYMGKISDEELPLVKAGEYQLNDRLGRAGIEQQYEQSLKGSDGSKEVEVNALGREQVTVSEVKPTKGKSLILNIDLELQKNLYDFLERQTARSGGSKAAAIALDPNNGAVLAAVSLPSFDNNIFTVPGTQGEIEKLFADINQPLFFRPWQGEYPSGSTFKPLVAVAALSEKIIDLNTTFLSTGGLAVSEWWFPDWKAGGHGRINIITAIAESVNTFFYYIGGGYGDFRGLGIDRIVEYAKRFGLTRNTQVDWPYEASGFLPSKEWKQEIKQERWYVGDTYNASIGQGDILVTPLQLAVAYSAIINGGTIYSPQIMSGYKDEVSGQTTEVSPVVMNSNFIDKGYLSIIKQGLGAVVNRGSAQYLNLLPVSSGGKTGTAQVGGDKNPHAWFIGFAPYDSPEIILAIVIENGGEGSTYAVPVAFDVFNWYFSQ